MSFFFRLPWFVYLVAAAGLVAFGLWLDADMKKDAALRAEALTQAPPAAISASAASSEAFSDADEIVVRGQIAMDAIYDISVSGRKTIDRSATTLFMLDADATGPGVVKTVVLMDTDSSLEEFMTLFGQPENGPISQIVEVNGEKAITGKLDKTIEEIAEDSGLTLTPETIYVEPFMKGREAALSRPAGSLSGMTSGLAALLAIYGAIRFFLARRKRAAVS